MSDTMSDVTDQDRVRELVHGRRDAFISIRPPAQVPEPVNISKKLIEGLFDESVASLEIAGDREAVVFGVRGTKPDHLRFHLESHFPHAELDIPKPDPMRLGEGERAFTSILKIQGPEQAPIQTFDDQDVQSEGTEPLLGVTGTMQQLRDGERVLVRMVVRPKERGYFSKYERDALAGSGGSNELERSLERDEQRLQRDKKTSTPGNIGILALVACLGAALLLTGFRFTFPTATDFAPIGTYFTPAVTYEYGLGFVLAWIASVVVVEILLWKILRGVKPRRQFLDPKIIGERVDHQAMDFEIQIVAFVPDSDEWKERARALSDRIADEYAGYGRSLGSAIVSHAGFEGVPDDAFRLMTQKRRPFPLSGRAASVIGTRELAGLWHLPATHVRPPNILRSASRHWPVMSSVISKGTPVGVTTVGRKRLVRLSADATRRHQFYVGASGEGKSTLMLHVLLHAMRQKANGENDGAVVVVDPHGDLAWDLLELVPPEIAHKVRFIDLSDRDRVVGINVLSPTFSSDRDVTADLLVDTVSRHWEFWGPNMASILSHSVKTLHEANTHPDVPPEEEYTLLDVRSLLDVEAFRRSVLEKIHDENLKRFWLLDFPNIQRDYVRNIQPITARLMEYSDSRIAAAMVGQRFSTINLRESLEAGDIMLVSAKGSNVGGGVARLISSYILMMVDHIIEAQGEVASEERQRVMVAVDEMHMLKGVPFESMLNNWRKFGGSLLLGTQTLSGVREFSPALEDSLLTNVGVLAVFRVGADDAERLAANLGESFVSKDDILSLDAHHAYVRLRSRTYTPPFSMKVLPKPPGRPVVADEILSRSARYSQDLRGVHQRLQEEVRATNALGLVAKRRR